MKTLSSLAACIAWIGLSLLTTGCGVTTKQFPAERVVGADNERVLWQALFVAIDENGYRVGGGANPSTRKIRSSWKLDLAPFKGQGFRSRVIVSYTPEPRDPDAELEMFDVSIRVEKETNESFRASDPAYAKWEPADDDREKARKILQDLRAYLQPMDIDLAPEPDPIGID